MSKLPAIAAVLGVALALTACSGADTGKDTKAPAASAVTAECTEPGSTSNAVTVTGEVGAAPTVTFDLPAAVEATERTVAVKGDGTLKAEAGSQVDVSYTLYHGATGEVIEATPYEEGASVPFVVDEASYFEGLVRALNCSVEGDRIVAAIPPADLFGETGSEEMGITADDSVIFVFDINAVTAPAEPVDAAADMVTVDPDADGMPGVDHADDGAPIVTIPDSKPSSDLTLAVLAKGDGDVVADGDTVEVNYTGVNWTTGETFDSSWPRGESSSFPTTGVIPGFGAALVGQAVGAEIVVVIPPEYGYGAAGAPAANIGATDTLVFVVEILGTTPA